MVMQDGTTVGSRQGGSQCIWLLGKKNSPEERKCSEWLWAIHLWGCSSSSCFIREEMPERVSRLLQQWLQVRTATSVTADAHTAHICDPSAIIMGSCSCGADMLGQHGAILPSANMSPFSTTHSFLPHSFTCNKCNYSLLQFILMLVKWLKTD